MQMVSASQPASLKRNDTWAKQVVVKSRDLDLRLALWLAGSWMT